MDTYLTQRPGSSITLTDAHSAQRLRSSEVFVDTYLTQRPESSIALTEAVLHLIQNTALRKH